VEKSVTKRPQRSLTSALLIALAGILFPGGVICALLALLIAGSDTQLMSLSSPTLRWVLAGAFLLCAASGAALFLLVRRACRAIDHLTGIAHALASGRPNTEWEVGGGSEIDSLSAALRELAASNEAAYREMEDQNRSLEEVVCARTAELRQKNLALAFQNEKVIEANQLKSSFLASVSHELRTPLNAILALSEMLRDGLTGALTPEQTKQAAMIHQSGENLLGLINEVLDLSRIETGRMEVLREKVDIVAALADAAAGLSALAEEKGIGFTIETLGKGIEVETDVEKLRQIVVNLVGNAIKFTREGGVEISLRLHPNEDLLHVEVCDTGPGIAPKDQHAIFQEFRRLNVESDEASSGTGLGLAISKKLVGLLGGDIWVDSALGRGSRFCFLVPVRRSGGSQSETSERGAGEAVSASDPAVKDTVESEVPRQRRVLVADDDIIEAGVLGRYLRQHGYSVQTATDAQDAMTILRHRAVDLVILDLFVRGNEGFRLLKRMGRDEQLAQLPVVVNTARTFAAEERRYLASRVRSCFAKGTRGVRDLIGLVDEILDGSSPEAGAAAPKAATKRLRNVA
jgi:signal transduction histidine kinase/CheY-like chemotaxis protein